MESNCLNYEKEFTEITRKDPPIVHLMAPELEALEGNNTCSQLNGLFPFNDLVPAFEDMCRSIHDGLLNTGISNSLVVIYRYLGEQERVAGDFS